MNKYAMRFEKILNTNGYDLLTEYIATHTKVYVKCPEGHTYWVEPSKFKIGRRCPKCSNRCSDQAMEQLITLLDKEGYKLISEYINTHTKVEILCANGHKYWAEPNSYKSGHRCPQCSKNSLKYAKKQFVELLDSEGYSLLSSYKNARTCVKVECPKGHDWEIIPDNFKRKYYRCPHCAGSSGQRLLQEKIEEYIKEDVIYNDRKVLDGLELDIYYPKLKIAIEYQGNYWHSLPEHIERDERKKQLCKELGVKLIEVWDKDFLQDPDNIITGLMSNYFEYEPCDITENKKK
jgi:very-short-patch-repair endonuclease